MSANLTPIGDLVEPVGTWNPASLPDDDFTYIDLSSVSQATKRIVSASRVVGAEAPSRARQIIGLGDILVSTVRPNLNGVAPVTKEFDGATASTGFCVLRSKPMQLLSSYLMHWVQSPQFVESMVRQATGASYPAVSDRIVKNSTIPLPPLPEQRRIAAILDKADALRRKRKRAIQLLDSLTQSIFLEMFGDPAENPNRYPALTFGQIAEKMSDGPFGSNLKSEHYVDKGVRVIRLQNIGVGSFVNDDAAYISEGHFDRLRKHECRPGDILIGTLGDPNLRACIQPSWLHVALNKADCVQLRVDSKVASAEFVTALLNSPSTERMAHGLILGQTRARISMGRLRNLAVPIPPLYKQKEFAAAISLTGSSITSARALSAFGDDLFASLQSRAFSGHL